MLRWTRTIQLIAVLCLLAAGSPAAAQSAAIGGLDAQRLRLGPDSLVISLIRDGDTIAIGRIWDELQLVHEGGEALLRRVYRSEDRVLGARVDTLVDHHASLLPVRHRSRTSRSQEVLDFSDSQVLGWIRLTNGDSTSVDVALPTRMYNGSSFDLILRAAPLAEGWIAEVPAFIASSRSMITLRARVAGIESIEGADCWRLDADFGGSATTFWIHEQTRDLCQQAIHLDPGTTILFGRSYAPAPRAAPRPSV